MLSMLPGHSQESNLIFMFKMNLVQSMHVCVMHNIERYLPNPSVSSTLQLPFYQDDHGKNSLRFVDNFHTSRMSPVTSSAFYFLTG